MKNWWPVFLIVMLAGCSNPGVDLSGNTPINKKDFMAAFKVLSPPLTVSDTNVRRLADTVTIGYKALQQFFPDSALALVVGNDTKQTIHPVGQIEKSKETYLLVNFTDRKKITRMAVFVIDKKEKFLAVKEIFSTEKDNVYRHTVAINREPTFMLVREKAGKDNTLQFTRTGWVYNDAGLFTVVVNDSNEDTRGLDVINPLDTLPRTQKYSGDYIRDKKNMISIRDNGKPGTYLFFIHFEKNDGSCIGELKGEMSMKGAASAQYTAKGDPCVIDFTFEGNRVTLKEQGTCGNHRGMRCFFDDTFVKKKEMKAKKKAS